MVCNWVVSVPYKWTNYSVDRVAVFEYVWNAWMLLTNAQNCSFKCIEIERQDNNKCCFQWILEDYSQDFIFYMIIEIIFHKGCTSLVFFFTTLILCCRTHFCENENMVLRKKGRIIVIVDSFNDSYKRKRSHHPIRMTYTKSEQLDQFDKTRVVVFLLDTTDKNYM